LALVGIALIVFGIAVLALVDTPRRVLWRLGGLTRGARRRWPGVPERRVQKREDPGSQPLGLWMTPPPDPAPDAGRARRSPRSR
jgi:hypothetical protein